MNTEGSQPLFKELVASIDGKFAAINCIEKDIPKATTLHTVRGSPFRLDIL